MWRFKVVERLSTETLAIEDRQVSRALQFIRDHACDPVTVADVLKAVPMARRTLERRFNQALGRSPAA